MAHSGLVGFGGLAQNQNVAKVISSHTFILLHKSQMCKAPKGFLA